jgi:hypothetical protein
MVESEIFITAASILSNLSSRQAQEDRQRSVLEGEMNITALRAQSQPTHRSEKSFITTDL